MASHPTVGLAWGDIIARLRVQELPDIIQLMVYDAIDMKDRIQERLLSSTPYYQFFPVSPGICEADLILFDPLPDNSDETHMREHVEKLNSLLTRMAEWEKRLDEIPDARPSMDKLRQVEAAMRADLETRRVLFSNRCLLLDPRQQAQMCQWSAHAGDINLSSLLPSLDEVDEVDEVQMQGHLQALKAVSLRLRSHEKRLEQLFSCSTRNP
jgi:hypothetical protein